MMIHVCKKKIKLARLFFLNTIFCLLIFNTLSAQNVDPGFYPSPDHNSYLEADRHARGMNYTGNPDSLAKALTAKFDNPYLKYKAIYSWIAYHIEYDFEGLNDETLLVTTPLLVLDSLKTICSGYANLMCFLCKKVDLPCEVISGWARTSTDNFEGINWMETDHAWNAIKINGEWRYCDATWGSGYGKTKKKKDVFVSSFTSAYFNMSAEWTFLQHYPQKECWQKEIGRTKTEFENQAIYHRSFFTQYIREINQTNKYIKWNLFGAIPICIKSSLAIHSIRLGSVTKTFSQKKIDITHSAKFRLSKDDHIISLYVNNRQIVSYLNKTQEK